MTYCKLGATNFSRFGSSAMRAFTEPRSAATCSTPLEMIVELIPTVYNPLSWVTLLPIATGYARQSPMPAKWLRMYKTQHRFTASRRLKNLMRGVFVCRYCRLALTRGGLIDRLECDELSVSTSTCVSVGRNALPNDACASIFTPVLRILRGVVYTRYVRVYTLHVAFLLPLPFHYLIMLQSHSH